jgi:hypothetical protein
MREKVSIIDVPQLIGEMLNRVALRHDEFVIERKGKPMAALVPVERLEQLRRFARRHAVDFLDAQKGTAVSEAQAMNLALEAQRWARKQGRKPRRRTK